MKRVHGACPPVVTYIHSGVVSIFNRAANKWNWLFCTETTGGESQYTDRPRAVLTLHTGQLRAAGADVYLSRTNAKVNTIVALCDDNTYWCFLTANIRSGWEKQSVHVMTHGSPAAAYPACKQTSNSHQTAVNRKVTWLGYSRVEYYSTENNFWKMYVIILIMCHKYF